MSNQEVFDTLVIGSGPGGYAAAIRSSQLGLKTAIVERDHIGGVCTHVGCIPSKALIAESQRFQMRNQWHNTDAIAVFEEAQAFKQAVVNKQSGGVRFLLQRDRVTSFKGEASFIDAHTALVKGEVTEQVISFKNVIIATGSRPIELNMLPFGERILSSTEALSLSKLPVSLVVIGGGYIGVELGQMFAKFGTKVTILEGGKQVLPGFEEDLVAPVVNQLRKDGITIITNAKATKAEQAADKLMLYYTVNQEQQLIEAEYALVTVGRKANTDGALGLERIGLQVAANGLLETDEQCRTMIPNVFAIGDIRIGPALAHKASYEAKVAAEAIAGLPSAVDYKAIPLVVFSEPEVASVGLTESEGKERGIAVITGKSVFSINGRALALKETEGFVKLVAHQVTGAVLGAQIVGVEASSLISELTLAIEMGATVEDLAMTIHPHPTLGEVIMEAAELTVHKMKKSK